MADDFNWSGYQNWANKKEWDNEPHLEYCKCQGCLEIREEEDSEENIIEDD